jgi:hypothetical protein
VHKPEQPDLDAADTEHVLLPNTRIWHPSCLQRGGSAAERLIGQTAQQAQAVEDAALVPGTRRVRVLRRSFSEGKSELAFPPQQQQASTVKRSRSGLNNRLPSLVELPVAEAAGCCGSKSVSMPGGWEAAAMVDGNSAARAANMAQGVGRFSSSSPGTAAMTGIVAAGAEGGAHAAGLPGEALIASLDRARRSPCALALVRAAMCTAVFGAGLSHLSSQHSLAPEGSPDAREASPSPSPQSLRMSPEAREHLARARLDARQEGEQQRHGSQALMQILETRGADSRTEWLQLMQRKGAPSGSGAAGQLHQHSGSQAGALCRATSSACCSALALPAPLCMPSQPVPTQYQSITTCLLRIMACRSAARGCTIPGTRSAARRRSWPRVGRVCICHDHV